MTSPGVFRPSDMAPDEATRPPSEHGGTRRATFVLLHGAGGRADHWQLVTGELHYLGHRTVAVDLPCEREVGLAAYADAVVEAVGEQPGPFVLVAQSLAGFIAPLLCGRLDVELMVLVAAMVPLPGESGAEWWDATGHEAAVVAQGLPDDAPETLFTHDVDSEVLELVGPTRDQTSTLFEEPWPLPAWPEVPTRFLVARDDRFFPAPWLRGVVEYRLGIGTDEVPGGHCMYLSEPVALAAALDRCWGDLDR